MNTKGHFSQSPQQQESFKVTSNSDGSKVYANCLDIRFSTSSFVTNISLVHKSSQCFIVWLRFYLFNVSVTILDIVAAEVLQRFIFFGASVTIWDIVASCWGVSTIYPFARQLFCKQACWQGLPGVYIGGFLLTRQNTYCGVFLLARTDIGQWALPNGQQRRVLCVLWGAIFRTQQQLIRLKTVENE